MKSAIRWWLALLLTTLAPLADAGRVILQDNLLYDYAGTADAWLNEGLQRDNYGGATNLRVRCDISTSGGGYVEDCIVVRFDLPAVSFESIPAAQLRLFYRTAGSMQSDNVLGIKPYRLTADWFENTRNGQSGQGVSWRWRDQNEQVPWTNQAGGWYDKVDDGNGTNRVKRSGGSGAGIEPLNWVPFNVRPSVQQWYGGAANHGFVLFSCLFEGGGNNIYAEFDSREFATAANRPQLAITFQGARLLWEGNVDGNWNTNTLNWRLGGVRGWYDHGDHVRFDGGSRTNVMIAAEGVTPGSVVFSNGIGRFTFSGGAIGGNATLAKYRAGEVRLAASNGYTGATTVYEGRLIVGANGALGATNGGTFIANGAALVLEGGVSYSIAEPLTLAGDGGDGYGALRVTTGISSFAGAVTMGTGTVVGVPAGATLTLGGIVQGGASWSKVGAGTLVLGGVRSNTFSGALTVQEGTLALDKGGAIAVPGPLVLLSNTVVRTMADHPFGTTATVMMAPGSVLDLRGHAVAVAALTMAGGQVQAVGGGRLTLLGDFQYTGVTQAAIVYSSLDLGDAVRAFVIADGTNEVDVWIYGAISAGGVIKTGAGTLALVGSGGYEGGTTVREGTLRLDNQAGSATGAGAITVEGGAMLAGTGSATGTVWVLNHGIVAPGPGAGKLTFGHLHLAPQALLRMDLDDPNDLPSNDLISVQGNLVLDGRIDVQRGPRFAPGRYRLMTYTGTLTDNGLDITGVPSLYDVRVDTDTPGEVALEVFVTPDHYVSLEGANIPPYTNWATAAHVIQDALDVAKAGDTVWVAAGTYDVGGRPAPGMTQTNRVYVGEGIFLRSVDGPERTFIVGAPDLLLTNGPAAIRCAWLEARALLSGFTLTNGYSGASGVSWEGRGGGLCARMLSVVSQCWIVASHAWEGGGAAIEGAVLTHSCLSGNRAERGGGLYADRSQGLNSLIIGNESRQDGGGILATGSLLLRHVTVSSNAAGDRGGGLAAVGSITAQNSIVYGNLARNGTNIWTTTPPLVEYSCVWPHFPGKGNTAQDPSFQDPARGNYRLRYASPCIDRGIAMPDVRDDLAGVARPVDGDFDAEARYDMGAYEYDPARSDSDADGMPDQWEHGYGLHPLDPDDAQENLDNDPFTNLQEYIADTNPSDPLDYFRITAFSNVPPQTVFFTSSAARVYTLVGSTNLLSGQWIRVPGAGPRLGKGGSDSLQDTNPPLAELFYRVQVDLP